jgi:hypothetical protein
MHPVQLKSTRGCHSPIASLAMPETCAVALTYRSLGVRVLRKLVVSNLFHEKGEGRKAIAQRGGKRAAREGFASGRRQDQSALAILQRHRLSAAPSMSHDSEFTRPYERDSFDGRRLMKSALKII